MDQVAVLIDAGYFWKQAGHVVHGTHNVRREDVHINYTALREQLLQCVQAQFPATRLLRIYWYDGPSTDGGKAASHQAIEETDDFKLRLGIRSGTGQKQKAVDGLIIADLIGLAQFRAIVGALLLSGDADLTPGVIVAQGLGIRVHLLSMGLQEATSRYLAAEIDHKEYWENSTVHMFATATNALVVPGDCQAQAHVQDGQFGVDDTQSSVVSPDIYFDLAQATLKLLGHPENPVELKNTAIPKKADSSLLWRGKQYFKRDLTEPEKRSLRDAFRDLLKSSQGVPVGIST